MGRVAGRAAFSFQRRVFEGEWTLLVRVTLDASRIRTGGQSGLLEFETSVRVVAIAALHRPFENLVMKRSVKLRLHFTMTTHTELRLSYLQHMQRREAEFLSVRLRHKDV